MKTCLTVRTRSRAIVKGFLITTLASLFLAPSADASFRISEILAVNDGLLRDENGDAPDWIEIHNPTAAPLSLAGWHLTDDPARLTQWTFPDVELPGGAFLIVFASGKDRANPGAELHTNFQLTSDGEFLALVEPDGTTIADAFSPAFPPQRANISFGPGPEGSPIPLVSLQAAGRLFIPADGSLNATWMDPEFDDTSWSSALTGVGYDSSTPDESPDTDGLPILRLDFNDPDSPESGSADTEFGFSTMTLEQNPATFGSLTVELSALGGAFLDDRDRTTPTDNPPAFTEDQLYDDFIFASGLEDGDGLRLRISGLRPDRDHRLTIWSFDTGSVNERRSDWIETSGGTPQEVITGYTFDGRDIPQADRDHTFSAALRSSSSGELVIEGRRNGGTSYGVFLNALELVEVGLHSLIRTDVGAAMSNQNASAWLRIPFDVSNPGDFEAVQLRMTYDDGFVAFLNGVPVASRNAPESLEWNSTATTARTGSESLVAEVFPIELTPGLLRSGVNVLAVHGLNVSADDKDFLMLPELTGFGPERLLYFLPPTPGAANGTGYTGLTAEPAFNISRGFYTTPFQVTLTGATPDTDIYWTTNGSPPTETTGIPYSGPIEITTTTALRARAFREQHVPSVIVTHTYLFLDDVVEQSATQPGYPTVWQASFPADYGMDPEIVNHPVYGATLKDDLRAIPTLSIVADHDALWHPTTGIYVDATRSGVSWERPASVELFNGDNTTEFQVTSGLRMQGNASRDNVRTPKHSFRLLFKAIHGRSKLDYDWFGGSPVDQFDNIVLRACFTDAWTTRYSPGDGGARYRPEDSLYLRDIWVKDSLADMGHLSGRNAFAHLYVNGLYWGLYNPAERLDASFFAEHLGGNKLDWDVIRDFSEVLAGSKAEWNQMMNRVNSGIDSEADYQAVAELVDVENLIDYMLLHIVAEAEDWPHHNWYAARRRATNGLPATRWIFLAWDQEIVLDREVRRNRVNVSNNDTPARIYSELRAHPEFRRLFGDRVHRHLFNDGALTPARNADRLRARAEQVHQAMVGESARWGDAREFPISPNPGTGETFTRDEWWVPELQQLYTNFFPQLTADNVARFRSAGLYPQVGAPEFNQLGGAVPSGFELILTHTNASGTIHFTRDGADPRVYGSSAIADSAEPYQSAIPLAGRTLVRARVLANGEWSALVEAVFHPPQNFSGLFLTEIHYHPPDEGFINGNEFEFLELYNAGDTALDLSGLQFTDGIEFTFPDDVVLAPGDFIVLVANPDQFILRHPGITPLGAYSGQLSNSGETVTLSDPLRGPVLSLAYGDSPPWPTEAD
ncbi:MAG TPA: lamin tail domain-containing protein, partial [Methylomirabilota bacterium]|nr:lamin tail domain-containing protein [Methylomirabilota bacterium]